MRLKLILISLFFAWFFNLLFVNQIFAATDCSQSDCSNVSENDKSSCLANNIQCLNQKINDTKTQAVTLRNTITILNNQVSVLQLQIDQSLHEISALEKEVQTLGVRIEQLNQDLDKLVDYLLVRVVELYKKRFITPLSIMFSFESLSTKASNIQYIKITQQQVADSMNQAESQRLEFDNQKKIKQQKQQELETKRIQLASQQDELEAKQGIQENLLQETNHNEEEFQKQLDSEKEEFLAIQAICSGQGNEEEIKHVTAGEKIATLIQGASCNSDGTHLHFSVREKTLSPITNQDEYFCKNPFSYLKKDISFFNCSTKLGCNHPASDPFVPSGSWDWPIRETIYFYQGFGATWAVDNVDWLPYDFHNGLDMRGDGLDVKAVQSGTLYHGSYSGGGGCELPYVIVRHDNSNFDSLYLHVNY